MFLAGKDEIADVLGEGRPEAVYRLGRELYIHTYIYRERERQINDYRGHHQYVYIYICIHMMMRANIFLEEMSVDPKVTRVIIRVIVRVIIRVVRAILMGFKRL